jgi:phosphate transport system substrate-binding protein
MKRALALMLVLVSLIGLALVAGRANAASTRSQDTTLTGAGSSFVFPLVSKWIPALGTAYGYNVNYSPIGSGGGVAAVSARTVDFGASDAPLSADQFTACKGCVQIPWALSATSIMYNLPGLSCTLHLSGPIIANIYLGKITTWSDAAIKAVNGSCNLPDTKITPVYRSDNSGTTWNITDYLSAVSPDWQTKLGKGVNEQWPTGIGAKGSSGVSGVLTRTEGAIGYADVAYALKNKIRFASILNASGKYATPGLRGIQAAAGTLPAKITGNGELSIVNPKKGNPLAYPISTFTYVIAPTSSPKGNELRKMVYWAVTTGQTFAKPLLFQPLPQNVQAFAYKQIKLITAS